jgi:hypothetical protein
VPEPLSRWQDQSLRAVSSAVRTDAFWRDYLPDERVSISCERAPMAVHLAVFNQPYLDFLLEGRKTVESRFSAVRCPPYQRVKSGDVLVLKPAGGPIVGLCLVQHVWFYTLDRSSWRHVRRTFAKDLCAQDPKFWQEREHAQFATLMRVTKPTTIAAVECEKRDRRGWVVLREAPSQAALEI